MAAVLALAGLGLAGCGDGGAADRGAGSARPAAETVGGTGAPAAEADRRAPRSGERLARELGCGGCHDGVGGDPGRTAPPLPGRASDPAWTFAYLEDPAAYATGTREGRMPGFHLDESERLALSLFLASEGGGGGAGAGSAGEALRRAYRAARDAHPDLDRERGRRIFVALNCAGCHPHPDVEPRRAGPDLAREGERARPGWLREWLQAPTALRPFGHPPGTGSRMPDFRLAAAEADSLAAFLSGLSGDAPPTDAAPAEGGVGARDSLTPYRRWKAGALLRERLACLGCHRIGGEGGRIGPALDGVAARRRPEWIAAMVRDPRGAVPGTVMPEAVLPAATRTLLLDYLAALREPVAAGPRDGYLSLVEHPLLPPPTQAASSGAEPRAAAAADGTGADRSPAAEAGPHPAPPGGEAAYRRLCATCHGAEGRGDGYNARYLPVTPTPHASAEHMSGRPSSTLFDGIHAGGRVLGRSARMPAFGGSLAPDEIWDLVAHLRRLCGCTGPAWSRDNEELPERVRAAGGGGGSP